MKVCIKSKVLGNMAVVALAGMLVMEVQAEVVLSNIDELWTGGSGFAGDSHNGLVFRTGSSASSIDGLSFSLLNGSDSTRPVLTFSAYLYQVDGEMHQPTSLLGSQSGLVADFGGVTGNFDQQTFSYTVGDLAGLTGVTLAADTEYAIALGNSDDTEWEIYWAYADSSVYSVASGYSYVGAVESSDGGSLWLDAISENYIASISTQEVVPEPATALSLMLGGLVVAGYRRIRKRYGL